MRKFFTPYSDSATMNLFCIILFTFLIATVTARSSTSTPELDYPNDYEEHTEEQAKDQEDNENPIILPKFITSPTTKKAKSGDSVTFDCEAQNATDSFWTWKKGQYVITQRTYLVNLADSRSYVSLENRSLVITSVKVTSGGYYDCIITITAEKNISVTHRLKVEGATEITSLRSEKGGKLHTGDKLELTCQVDGEPIPSIKWYFKRYDQEVSVPAQNKDHITAKDSDTLVIPSVTLENNGTFTCSAENGYSVDQQSIDIEVLDEGRKSHTDSRVSGSLPLGPSLTLFVTTIVLMNP